MKNKNKTGNDKAREERRNSNRRSQNTEKSGVLSARKYNSRKNMDKNRSRREEFDLFDDGISIDEAAKLASHYFTDDEKLEDEFRNFDYRIGATTLHLTSNSGVFSKNHVDKASKLLIETVLKEEAEHVVGREGRGSVLFEQAGEHLIKSADSEQMRAIRIADLGTGYGVILLALLSRIKGTVGTGYEVSSRALRLAKINAKKNGLKDRVEFLRGDIRRLMEEEAELFSDDDNVSEERASVEATVEENAGRNTTHSDELVKTEGKPRVMYDIVVTNPPIRAGKEICYKFYDFAKMHLEKGGRLYVVISKNQGASSTKKHLFELFGNAEIVEKEGEFRVICCVK